MSGLRVERKGILMCIREEKNISQWGWYFVWKAFWSARRIIWECIWSGQCIYPIYHDKGISGHAVRVQMRFRSKHRDCVTIFLCDKMGHIK